MEIIMSAYFTKFLLLFCLATIFINCTDAKFGNGGEGGSKLSLPSRVVVPISFRSRLVTTTRKTAVAAATNGSDGTSPQQHCDVTVIISSFRGGGSESSGIEENPDYDSDRRGKGDDADEDDYFTTPGDVDGSDENENDEIRDEIYPEKNKDHDYIPSLSSKPTLKPQGGNSRIRRHNNDTKHQKSKTIKSKSSVNKHLLKFAKRHQLHCYILLTIIAFRSDIFELACRYHLIPTVVDPITSQRIIKIHWSTDVLKLIFVIEVVRRYFLPSRVHEDTGNYSSGVSGGDITETYQNSTQSQDQKPSSTALSKRNRNPPILPLLLILLSAFLLLPRNFSYFILPMCLRLLLTTSSGGLPPEPDSPMGKIMLLLFGRGDYYSGLAKRMAYLPPLEQHYTFEQLNERYYRDWGAFRKAYDTHPMVAAAATNSHPWNKGGRLASSERIGERFARGAGVASLVSLVTPTSPKSSLLNTMKPSNDNENALSSPTADCYPSEYNNGTVIILDMTKLDTQASKMESVRDQINFLTHYLAYAEESSYSQSDQRQYGDMLINGTNATEPGAIVGDNANVDRVSNITQSFSAAVRHEPAIEIIVLLESPGGGVSQYGLAASHLQRLRSNPKVKLTICIDSVAASGGYMMACMSSPGQLFCAPFAMVGSIGVIGQSLNVQKTLEGFGVRPYVFRGGKMKNPVGMIGDVTKEGVMAMQLMVDRVHDAFRDHVASARGAAFANALQTGAIPKQTGKYFQLGASDDDGDESNSERIMDQVATGDVFLGVQAIKLGLVDRLITSDEYISERVRHGARVLKLINYHRPMGLWSFLGAPSPQHRMISSVAGNSMDAFSNLAHKAVMKFGSKA